MPDSRLDSQISVRSASVSASSTSTPRKRIVFSILLCPSRTALLVERDKIAEHLELSRVARALDLRATVVAKSVAKRFEYPFEVRGE
jgi:hypothetical protein